MSPELAQQIDYWREKIPSGAFFCAAAAWTTYWLWQDSCYSDMIVQYEDLPALVKVFTESQIRCAGHAEAGFSAILSRWLAGKEIV